MASSRGIGRGGALSRRSLPEVRTQASMYRLEAPTGWVAHTPGEAGYDPVKNCRKAVLFCLGHYHRPNLAAELQAGDGYRWILQAGEETRAGSQLREIVKVCASSG